MNIHQLSLLHDPIQDRILLRISTTEREEIRLWLTRRLTLGLQPYLQRASVDLIAKEASVETALTSPQAKEMLAEFKQQENLQKADFATPYEEPVKFLLGEHPLLVTDIQISPQNDGTLVLGFQEKVGAPPHRAFQVKVKSELVIGLQHLLSDAVAKSGWLQVEAVVKPQEKEPDQPPGESRPPYLN
jgi:hypothetical protein